MAFRRISPAEAQQLMTAEGYHYIDVRSVPEFEQAHPTGARNVPLAHAGPGGMTPNADFLAVMQANFPVDAKLVIGCKSGGRSQRAAMMLEAVGYTNLVEMRGGMTGEADMMGRTVEKGWAQVGLPMASRAEPGASFAELLAKKG